MTSDAYASVRRTVRHCRRRGISPDPPGCVSRHEARLMELAMLDGVLGVMRHLPLTGEESAALFDAIFEASLLIGWLDDIAQVLAGRREPRWIGPAPHEIRVIRTLPARWRAKGDS